jgi:glycosyltransferase involved in cell wall biosynthesis
MTEGRRRIVHVFATFGRGGPQTRAVELVRALGDSAEHVVMAMDGCTDCRAMLPNGAQVTFAAPPPRRGSFATVRRQRAWLRELRPDLVLTYNWGAIESVVAARTLGLPLVHHEDGFGPDETTRRLRRRSWLRRLVLRRLPVVVPSHVLLGIAQREWGLRDRDLHCLPNGVDVTRFAPGDPVREPVLGTVGGLRAEKDHANLLRAAARLGPDVRVRLVGGGPLTADLQRLARDLGLGERVEFAGHTDRTEDAYRGFQVFVLPSRTEQMPIAMLEAMACGLPVVATDVGDVRRILPEEAAGCIVPAADAAALAAALARVLGDPAQRAALGASNRRRVERDYEQRECLARFLAVYDNAGRGV